MFTKKQKNKQETKSGCNQCALVCLLIAQQLLSEIFIVNLYLSLSKQTSTEESRQMTSCTVEATSFLSEALFFTGATASRVVHREEAKLLKR